MIPTIVNSSQINNLNQQQFEIVQAQNDKSSNNKIQEFPKTQPLSSLLKFHTFLHKSETDKNQLNKLYASYDELLALDDDLILLILENNVINALIHKQKILIEAISAQFNREEKITPHAGRFEKHERRVTIVNSGLDYSSTLIHELTHAATGFAFTFDPWPVQYRLSIINDEELRKKIFVDSMIKFRQAPGFPHPLYEGNRRKNSFNIDALKFKQCVHKDLQGYAEKEECDIFSEKYEISLNIASFMFILKSMAAQKGDGVEILQEILPYYIQCRAEILKIAKDKKLPASEAYKMLAEAMPNIHAYCETDFKKVLKHRLEYYHDYYYYYYGYNSEYLDRHLTREPPSVRTTKTTFCEDGSLKFVRDVHIPKRSAELSCAMFAHKARGVSLTEPTQITAVEMDEIIRPRQIC